MIVDVDVQATPSACKPVQYIVSVVSAVDYGKRSVQPGNNTGGYMPLHGRHLHVVLRPPVLRLPPYVASAAAVQENLREVLAKGTYNNVRIESFACPQALMCVVSFGRAPGKGVVRVRYVLTGYRQRPVAGSYPATTSSTRRRTVSSHRCSLSCP